MNKDFEIRKYQTDCDNEIYKELHDNNNNKCLVKMFCGTGKSRIMRKCKIIIDKSLVVFVFPSLSLIDQFYGKYFDGDKTNVLKISSETKTKSTTDPIAIKLFLSLDINKFICVTYQSFNTLLDNLDGIKIDVCIFDEAHHLRNSNTRHHASKLLQSNIRWLISGTPIQNKRTDFYNLCASLNILRVRIEK